MLTVGPSQCHADVAVVCSPRGASDGWNAGGDRLTARILLACGLLAFDDPEAAGLYFTEAITFARAVDDRGASDEKSREGGLEFRGRCLPTTQLTFSQGPPTLTALSVERQLNQ